MRFELQDHRHHLEWQIGEMINAHTCLVRFRFLCGCGLPGDTYDEVHAGAKKFAQQMKQQRGWVVRWGKGTGGRHKPDGSDASWYVYALRSSLTSP